MAATTHERSYARLSEAYPPRPTAEPFTADGVFDKLAALTLAVIVSGIVAALLLPDVVALPALLVALGAGLVGTFKPATAKVCAPVYAVAEGVVLGVVSRSYADLSDGIVPMAVLFTGGVFVGCLLAFRTGLVRVTPRFVTITLVATLGMGVVVIASLFGLEIPGLRGRGLVFGVIGLVVGVMNLFVDFEYVAQAERRGASKDGEWYGALGLLASLVLVYVSILRILGASRR